MSDKSFGDYANRNIVKNPLLSTAVTGLSIEDLTHNAVLVPVAPNQAQITGLDQTGTYTQTLANTEHEHTHFPSGDSNSNMLHSQPPIPVHSHSLDSEVGHNYDRKLELPTATVSKASVKSEDDFDVNEYFARLQGTRYVSAPLHSHTDPNANLTETEENLEEINLNDDKTLEVQQSLTADIAQNFSQLPNVLPHVASAVFSSFSNMWNMKSREQTPDDRAQNYHDIQFQENQASNQFQSSQESQKYQDVQFQGHPELSQFQSQGFASGVSSVPLLKTDDVVKEVAPPPKEPPICGTSNFRLTTTKKKYAQIPGLSTGASQQIAFNPLTQNVPSYFIPSEDSSKHIEENKNVLAVEPSCNIRDQTPKNTNESYNILTPIDDTTIMASDFQPNANIPTDNHPTLFEDISTPINLQNPMPDIPPPPMFSAQRTESATGKSVLPPSVARRIGSNHPVLKTQIIQPTVTDNIFIPTFDQTPITEPKIFPDNAALPTYNTQVFAPNYSQFAQPIHQEPPPALPESLPVQMSQQSSVEIGSVFALNTPPGSTFANLLQTGHKSVNNVIQETMLEPAKQTIDPAIYSPFISDPPGITSVPVSSELMSAPLGPTSAPQSSNIFSPPPSVLQSSAIIDSYPGCNPILYAIPTSDNSTSSDALTMKENPLSEPPKALMEPPKAIGASNFRMIKKRPQYYSGPIEGIGSISNSMKPTIPSIDSSTFQGALFTPEQLDESVPTFDISKHTETDTSYKHFDLSNQAPNMSTGSFMHQEPANQSYKTKQSYQNFGEEYKSFDLIGPTVENYEPKEEPKESKGFGIIGSLKSKLSNLDINKIQNSVTTFFDPAYNNAKKEDFFAHGDLTNNSQRYHAQPQSNFEIFMPNIDPNVQYNSSDQAYQNTYSQVSFDQSTRYNQHQNPPFMDQSYFHQPHESQLCNVYSQGIPTETVESSYIKAQNNANSLSNIQTKDDRTNYDAPTETAPIGQRVNILAVDTSSLNAFIPSERTNTSFNKPFDVIPCPGEYKDVPTSNLVQTCKPTKLFESNNCSLYSTSLFEDSQCKVPSQLNPSEANTIFDISLQSNFLGYGTQGDSSVPIVTHNDIKNEVKSVAITEIAHGLTDKEKMTKKDCLSQSFSEEKSILSLSSVPLFDLGTIKADKVKNSNEQGDVKNLPLYERAKYKDVVNENASISFFEKVGNVVKKTDILEECDNIKKIDLILDSKINLPENISSVAKSKELDLNQDAVLVTEIFFEDSSKILTDTEIAPELNICETCREVNKPEERETEKDNLTLQLIENITSPIQLSNPVEVPLTEDNHAERVEFDAQQFEDISHITEETRETIHVHSATELLDDDHIKPMNYGWATEENYTSNPLKLYDHGYKVDSNAIGFFGDTLRKDEVPTNASDELKAEFKHQDVILPRQMSVPSAPPAEDDSKSDEGGILDVHSIELDAKEDFPIFEEFVIEPSETDDDKIEFKEKGKMEETELDSFTNRVEKFKKMEEVSDIEPVPKISELNNQSISMASYFDTGNYAADTHHYKNMLSSPNYISIPPGFEAEYKKRLALAKGSRMDFTTIPDTTTQTKHTVSVTTAHSVMPVGFHIVSSNIKSVTEKTEKKSESPFFVPEFGRTLGSTSIFDNENRKASPFMSYEPFNIPKQSPEVTSEEFKPEVVPDLSKNISPTFGSGVFQIPEASFKTDTVKMPKVSSIFSSQGVTSITSQVFDSSEPKIPEPSFVFNPNPSGTTASETIPIDKEAAPISTLPDPMNFFADSIVQTPSENVNRLASYFSSPPKTEHAKSFFELSQSQNHYKYVSSDKYEDLIKDLTSVQNLAVPTDQTIRHVNYFTVEYDVISPEFNKGDSTADVLINTDDKDLECLNHCSYCTALIYNKRYKVKATMNNTSEERTTERNMEINSSRATNSVTVNFDGVQFNDDTNEGIAVQAENRSDSDFGPVKHHWFYRVDVENKSIWRGFSVQDSRALENSFLSPDLNENTLVPTDGGRYDVNLMGRLRIPVYWSEKPTNVRRCSWFYKGTTDPRYVPYSETVATKLEEEYWRGITTGEWHRRLSLPNGEVVVMHGPSVMVHFLHSDAYSSPPQSYSRPRVVRRGHDDSEIEDAEPSSIDHLLLLCHGVGSACDMRFRSVEEVVEDFRATSLQLVQSHYKNSFDQGIVNRVEVLPISWHAALHSGETGVDRRLAQITLDSIPRLRNFTNDTVLDVLFYTSPVFCQTIVNTVCNEMNRVYELFKQRNPTFEGRVSLGGHSLGSVILYDLLCHQLGPDGSNECRPSEKNYMVGPAGTGRPGVLYPSLSFEPAALYALGSPIAIFECIRGVESLGSSFALPTCKNFFNIFHPYDPIAYRIEPLIDPRLKELKPYLIPHHKGRKRMHLELKDTMARVGADLKQKLIESLRSTWNKWKATPTDGSLDRVTEEDLDREQLFDETKEDSAKETELSTPEMLGRLNGGRRVDYVLQEAPLEVINEYLFAMSSHVGYWESEDTMLLMLREIYSELGVQPDSTVPQQTMIVQRTIGADGPVESPSTSGGTP